MTDGQTLRDSKDCACIASRGKNRSTFVRVMNEYRVAHFFMTHSALVIDTERKETNVQYFDGVKSMKAVNNVVCALCILSLLQTACGIACVFNLPSMSLYRAARHQQEVNWLR